MIKRIKLEIYQWRITNTNFTRKEATGMLVLVLLAFFLTSGIMLYELLTPILQQTTNQLDIKKADSLLAILEEQQPLDRATMLAQLQLKPFNPNTLTLEEWQAMGVQPYLAKKIINAVHKKFTFRQKSDLAKIWGFPKEEYERLKPYINLPDSFSYERKNSSKNDYYAKKDYPKQDKQQEYNSNQANFQSKQTYQKKAISKFDLNTADTAILKQIKGIGNAIALRIVEYRNDIGGFHTITQAKEAHKYLSDEALQELEKYAFITSDFKIKKLYINKADYQTLKANPYIKGKAASILLNYKKQHGNFKTIEDIQKSQAITEENLKKLIPYLSFD